ncbi:MAG: rane protein [Solirubrobacteraceae bacterium]|jgi:membrane protein|nr:rane protein [Solirubrobacteraceae bacterium]
MASATGTLPAAAERERGPAPFSLRTLKRAFDRFRDHNMTDHAAALTYYALMSLFPALLVGVSLFGLLGEASTVDRIARYLGQHGADRATVDAIRGSLRTAQSSGGAGLALALGLAVALYGASGAFGATGRALNVALGVDENRGFVRRKLLDVGSTLIVIVLGVVALVLVFLGGGVARDLFDTLGLGSTAASVWSVARWPAALVVAMAIYGFVYWAAPDDRERPRRWITPGAAAGVTIWLLASAGFFFYVANFGKYNATYGAFAAAVILLIWLWLTNVALLFGAELNAELDPKRLPRNPAGAAGERRIKRSEDAGRGQ